MMRRALFAAGIALVLVLAACDSPTIPLPAEIYPFALETTPPVVFHWPAGSTVRVFVAAGEDALRSEALEATVERAIDGWNGAAVFGEYRLVRTGRLGDADVLVRWSDVPLAVESPDPVRCGFSGGRAVTTFCADEPLERLLVFPLREDGPGRVRMIITLVTGEAGNLERLAGLVSHELGHALGLFRHPDPDAFPHSVMLSEPGSALPSALDRATVRRLYHTRADLTL